MKKFLILFLILIPLCLPAQIYDRGIFGTESVILDLDTCAVSDDSLTSRIVNWPQWRSMRGTLKIWGEMWVLSGKVRTFTVNLKPLHDYDTSELGISRELGTITVTDSVKYEFSVGNIGAGDWWDIIKGYQVNFVPDSTTSGVKIKGRELAK